MYTIEDTDGFLDRTMCGVSVPVPVPVYGQTAYVGHNNASVQCQGEPRPRVLLPGGARDK